MKNIENNFEKLTGMGGKSYHGGMTENGDELERKAKTPKELIKDGKIPDVRSMDKNAGVGLVDERVQGKKTGEHPLDLNNTTREQRKEFAEVRKALEGEQDWEKEPGLFDILMDILKDLLGLKDDNKAKEIIDNSEAMRGLLAYWRIKPQNKWDAKDYARGLFMLAPDTSDASKGLQIKLESDARNKGIKDKEFKFSDISNEGGKIRDKHKEFFLKRDEDRSEQEKKEEMVHRAIAMNGELWRETKGNEKVFDKLSGEKLAAFEEDIRLLAQQKKSESKDNASIGYLLRDINMGKMIKKGISGGSGSRGKSGEEEGSKEDKKKPEGLKKTNEEILKEIREINKNSSALPDILKTAQQMLEELQKINKSLKNFTETYIDTIIRNPNEINENPEKFQKMQRIYLSQRTRELEIQSALDEMAGEERKVLGGERDKKLYAGNVDQALDERMKRIEYFIEKKKNPKYLDPNEGDLESVPSNLSDSSIDLNEPDLSDDEKDRRKAKLERVKVKIYRKRMEKVYNEIKEEDIVSKQEGLYFQEIQRWVGTILKNTDIGYEGHHGKLSMSKEIYEKFRKIKEMPSNIYEYENEEKFEESILDAIKKLRGEKKEDLKMLEYYKGVSYLNLEGKGWDPVRREATGSFNYPSSLEATMMVIANDKGAEWRTGGEHELIDASGRFHRENFMLWVREEIWRQADWDSTVEINTQRGITFKAGFSQITLWDILYLPQYTQHQEIEMKGDASSLYKEGGKREFESNWEKEAKAHPDMPYNIRVDDILLEVWYAGLVHNDWIALYDINARGGNIEDWVKTQGKIANFNNYTRSGLAFRHFTLASHKEKEDKNYYDKKEQGSLGRMIMAGVQFYRHQNEFTEKYLRQDEKGNKRVADLEDNMAYKALDHDGSSVFLMSIAESALGMADPEARVKIKEAYGSFILERISDIEKKYGGKVASDKDKKEKMDMMIVNCRKEVDKLKSEKQHDLKISFDNFDKLVNLQLKIENVIVGKMIVSEDDKKNFKLGDKAVTRSEMEKEVGSEMRKNIGDFFKDVMRVEVLKTQDFSEDDQKKIKSGEKVFIKIGDIGVKLDKPDDDKNKGRIVTNEEWEQMGKKDENKKSVREIVQDFGDNFVKDEKDMGTIKEYEEAINAVKEVGDEFRLVSREGDQEKLDKISKILAEKKEGLKKCEGVYMSNKKEHVYDEIVSRREGLAMAMLTKVANMPRNELNIFRTTRPSEQAAVMIKEALKKSLGTIYGLEEMEARYGYDRVWYLLNHMEIADFNNTGGMPGAVQQGTYYNRTMESRNAAFRLGTAGGSEETVDEILALRLPTFLERTRVRLPGEGTYEHMLGDILQGGEGRDMKPRWERKLKNDTNNNYAIAKNAEHTDFHDQLDHAEKLRKILVGEDPHLGSFHEIVTINAWGVMKVDQAKARKLIDAYYNQARLVYGTHLIDYDKKIAVDGREVSVREHMLGKRTRETQDIIRDYYLELAGKGGKDAKVYEDLSRDIMKNPGLAVTMNMVTSGIHEHMTFSSPYEMWSTQHVQEIAWILDQYLHKEGVIKMEGNDKKIEKMPSMMPYELFNRLLGVQEGDSMDKFMFWDLFRCLLAGFLAGIGEAQKEMEDELTGQMKKQWIG